MTPRLHDPDGRPDAAADPVPNSIGEFRRLIADLPEDAPLSIVLRIWPESDRVDVEELSQEVAIVPQGIAIRPGPDRLEIVVSAALHLSDELVERFEAEPDDEPE